MNPIGDVHLAPALDVGFAIAARGVHVEQDSVQLILKNLTSLLPGGERLQVVLAANLDGGDVVANARAQAEALAGQVADQVDAIVAASPEMKAQREAATVLDAARDELGRVDERRTAAHQAYTDAVNAGQDPRLLRAERTAADDEYSDVAAMVESLAAKHAAAVQAVHGLRNRVRREQAAAVMENAVERRRSLRARLEQSIREFSAELVELTFDEEAIWPAEFGPRPMTQARVPTRATPTPPPSAAFTLWHHAVVGSFGMTWKRVSGHDTEAAALVALQDADAAGEWLVMEGSTSPTHGEPIASRTLMAEPEPEFV